VFNISTGSLVKDNIVSKVKVMDMLSLHLDRSDCPGSKDVPLTQRWEHLADEFKVPDDTKRQCENFPNGKLSPSESMFEYLRTTMDSLTIGMLKGYLRELHRLDVIDELVKNSNVRGKLPPAMATQISYSKLNIALTRSDMPESSTNYLKLEW